MGHTRPILSPNEAQLEELARLTKRAHRRSCEQKEVEEELTHILKAKESMIAANQFDYFTRQRQFNQMDRHLERLNNSLIGIQDEEAADAIEE